MRSISSLVGSPWATILPFLSTMILSDTPLRPSFSTAGLSKSIPSQMLGHVMESRCMTLVHSRRGHHATFSTVPKRQDGFLHVDELPVLRLFFQQSLDQFLRFGVVGCHVLQVVAAQEIDGHRRFGVVVDEHSCRLRGLYGRGIGNLLAEAGHQLIVAGSLHLHLLQVRGIGLHVDRLAGHGKQRLFGEVGEHQHEGLRLFAVDFLAEPAAIDFNGIELGRLPVESIYIKLALVQVEETAFNFEVTAVCSTSNQNQGE